MKTWKTLSLIALCAVIAVPAFCQTRNANPQAVGLDVLIPDAVAFGFDWDNKANWEPYADVLGDGSLIFVCGTYDAEGNDGTERPGVVVIRPDLTVQEFAGFYADDGTPYEGHVDTVRADGNPPQIGGDKRPGMTRYAVGTESTPYNFDEFNSDGRWKNDYLDHFYCVQIIELTENGAQKITNVIDPFYGEQEGLAVGKGRTGGVAGLSNGNFACVVEDRGSLTSATGKAPVLSIIDGNTGAIIKGPFLARDDDPNTDGWDGITSFDGGFAFRVNGADTSIEFFDNEGNLQAEWEQFSNDGLESIPLTEFTDFTTSITHGGRGDGNHINSSIGSKFVFYTGKGVDLDGNPDSFPYLVKIDTETGQTVKEALVNELEEVGDEYMNWAQADRVSLGVDENDNVTVVWSDKANSMGGRQVLARVFNSDLEPVTETFLAFQNSELEPNLGMETYHPQCAMSKVGILITCRSDNVPTEDGSDILPANTHLFTVIENPLAETGIEDWAIH